MVFDYFEINEVILHNNFYHKEKLLVELYLNSCPVIVELLSYTILPFVFYSYY